MRGAEDAILPRIQLQRSVRFAVAVFRFLLKVRGSERCNSRNFLYLEAFAARKRNQTSFWTSKIMFITLGLCAGRLYIFFFCQFHVNFFQFLLM